MKVRKKEQSEPKPSRMGLVDETALDVDHCIQEDLVFTKEEVESFTYPMLRNLAAHVESDAINGKSVSLKVRDFFACQYSLQEFEDK